MMNLVMNKEVNAYKIEYIRRSEYQKIMQILNCFKKDNDVILFMYPDYWVNNYFPSKTSNFIKERIKKITTGYISPGIGYRDEMPLYWFELQNNNEFEEMTALTKSELFVCIVVDKNKEPVDYSFELQLREFGRFIIRESNNGSFIENVFPKIQLLIGNLNIVQGADNEEY
ncbi:MAG TPA: hypothetical protein DCK76_02280 [Desulfotomaculum sp.]|nr:MAG: hypothetical protein XD84_1798 [Desulfotomaculum sp. 46_80]HAG10226.1 hypothetical protein [Desulfotomaculum sp.]HBY04274.1 hypothetical protein [Desulfotomaculum sp.]